MKTLLNRALSVIGATTIIVLAANTVVDAATGSNFLLGRSNTASTLSTLTRTTSGSVLSLHTTKSSTAPIVTNGRGLISNLNAAMVGGHAASYFAPSSVEPIALAYIGYDGTLGAHVGVSSSVWDATAQRYAITLPHQNFYYASYAVNITPVSGCSGVAGEGSLGGKLLVYFTTSSGYTPCGFTVVVYKLP